MAIITEFKADVSDYSRNLKRLEMQLKLFGDAQERVGAEGEKAMAKVGKAATDAVPQVESLASTIENIGAGFAVALGAIAALPELLNKTTILLQGVADGIDSVKRSSAGLSVELATAIAQAETALELTRIRIREENKSKLFGIDISRSWAEISAELDRQDAEEQARFERQVANDKRVRDEKEKTHKKAAAEALRIEQQLQREIKALQKELFTAEVNNLDTELARRKAIYDQAVQEEAAAMQKLAILENQRHKNKTAIAKAELEVKLAVEKTIAAQEAYNEAEKTQREEIAALDREIWELQLGFYDNQLDRLRAVEAYQERQVAAAREQLAAAKSELEVQKAAKELEAAQLKLNLASLDIEKERDRIRRASSRGQVEYRYEDYKTMLGPDNTSVLWFETQLKAFFTQLAADIAKANPTWDKKEVALVALEMLPGELERLGVSPEGIERAVAWAELAEKERWLPARREREGKYLSDVELAQEEEYIRQRQTEEASKEVERARERMKQEAKDKAYQARQVKLESIFGPIDDFEMYRSAFQMLEGAVGAAFGAWIDGSMSAGDALRAFLADSMKSLAIEMAVRSLRETAYGFADLAWGTKAKAMLHFKAAGLFAVGAAAAGGAAKLLHGDGGGDVPSQSIGGPGRSDTTDKQPANTSRFIYVNFDPTETNPLAQAQRLQKRLERSRGLVGSNTDVLYE